MNDLDTAIKILNNENVNFVAVKDNKIIYKTKERGLKAIIDIYNKNIAVLNNASIADTVTGRVAALFLSYGKISSIYSSIISDEACKIFEDDNIKFSYENKVEKILNRDKTDICPMDKLSQGVNDIDSLADKIKKFMEGKNE